MKVKEAVYMVLDLVKDISDDSTLTEDHIVFLLKKYRSFLIKKELEKEKEQDSSSIEFETQEICIQLEETEGIPGLPCEGGLYLRSTEAIPKTLDGTAHSVYPADFYGGIHIAFVPRNRMRFVGTNRFLDGIIYCSIGPDKHLYLKSSNPQFLYLEKLRMSAVFEDFEEAASLLCPDSEDSVCDVLDMDMPIRDYLVPTLIELVEKEVLGMFYRPADKINNAADDMANLAAYIRQNLKSDAAKQVEGE